MALAVGLAVGYTGVSCGLHWGLTLVLGKIGLGQFKLTTISQNWWCYLCSSNGSILALKAENDQQH